jgi:general secretion pathway protein B
LPAVASSSAPGDTAPLRLADLSVAERRQLPTLKMSMHLWDAAPAQRFVILDGERVGEGDRIGDAVIDEITRDGVVLAWQGRRFKVPIQ